MNQSGIADTPIQGVRALGGQFQVNTVTANSQTFPSIGMDSAGDFTIAWQSEGQGLSFFNTISARRYDHNGNPIGDEFVVNTPDRTTDTIFPYVAMSGDGLIAITWSDTADANWLLDLSYAATIWGKVYNAQGAAEKTMVVDSAALSPNNNDGANCTAAFDTGDNLAIAWQKVADSDNLTTTTYGCYAQEYDFSAADGYSGAVIRPTFRVNGTNPGTPANAFWPGDQKFPQIVMDADGDMTVSYTGFGPNVPYDNVDRYVQQHMYYSGQTLSFDGPNVHLGGWFQLTLTNNSGVLTTTDDIQFDATDLTTTASNIQTALAAKVPGTTCTLLGQSPYSAPICSK